MHQALELRELSRNENLRKLLAVVQSYKFDVNQPGYAKWRSVKNRLLGDIHQSENLINDLRHSRDAFDVIETVEEKKVEFEDRWGDDGLGDIRHEAHQHGIPFEEYL